MTRISTYILLAAMALGTPALAQKPASKFKSGAAIEQVNQLKYTFTQLTAAYAPLTTPISLTGGISWDDPTLLIPMPFPINLNGAAIDELVIDGLGAMVFGEITANPGVLHAMLPFETDIIDRGYDSSISLSSINYKVEGAVGSRVLKIEWKEVGSYGEYSALGGILTNYISFQAWIYEGTHVIEFRYGANTITNTPIFYEGETGPLVGFGTETQTSLTTNLLSGSAANPTFVLSMQAIIGTPANGTVYRFTPVGTGTSVAEQQLSNVLKAYPNPATDLLQLQLQNNQTSALVQLYDLSGREVKRLNMSEMQQSVDISDLAAGMYNLRVEGVAGSLKIIKK